MYHIKDIVYHIKDIEYSIQDNVYSELVIRLNHAEKLYDMIRTTQILIVNFLL